MTTTDTWRVPRSTWADNAAEIRGLATRCGTLVARRNPPGPPACR